MASDTIYQSFEYACREENERYVELINRGKIYLTICTFFLGGIGFKINSEISASPVLTQVMFLIAAFLFIASFMMIILAMGIYSHEGIFDPASIIEEFGDEPPSDADFLDQRIADITTATAQNVCINDKRAKFLFSGSILMLAGIGTAFFGLIFLVLN